MFSRDDIERIIIQRLKAEFPGNDLSDDVVRQLLQVLIKDIFVNPTTSIPIWSGSRQSMPGNPNRLVFERMAATINTWKKPDYRSLGVSEADWGPVKEYLEWTFPREAEREMLVNWLAWCLQNEGDKPGWAPFLYSSTKGVGQKHLCPCGETLVRIEEHRDRETTSTSWCRASTPRYWRRNW